MSFDVDRERLNRYLARIRENIRDLEEILSSSDADILSSTIDMKDNTASSTDSMNMSDLLVWSIGMSL